MAKMDKQPALIWVDAIDIRSDGIANIMSLEIALKKSLKKDLRDLWARKEE